MADYSPVPIPFRQKLRIFRSKGLPVLTFLAAVVAVTYLWQRELAPAGMVGEVYGISSEITAPVAGTLEGFHLEPFTRVEAGQLLGYLRTAPTEQLEAALDVVRAEIELTRLGSFDPVLDQQRNLLAWLELQQELLDSRADLASLRIRRAQAEREYRRYENLRADHRVPEVEVDRLRAEYEALAVEEQGLSERVEALDNAHRRAELSASGAMASLPESIAATLDWQEKQLRQIEADLAPLPVRAPTSGIVVRGLRSAGEFVVPGTIIATVRSEQPQYIIGYMKSPVVMEPRPGMEVEIIPRGDRSLRTRSEITEVGTEFEPLGLVFHGPFSGLEERALPMKIRIPAGLRLRPGELVDLRLIDSRS